MNTPIITCEKDINNEYHFAVFFTFNRMEVSFSQKKKNGSIVLCINFNVGPML